MIFNCFRLIFDFLNEKKNFVRKNDEEKINELENLRPKSSDRSDSKRTFSLRFHFDESNRENLRNRFEVFHNDEFVSKRSEKPKNVKIRTLKRRT